MQRRCFCARAWRAGLWGVLLALVGSAPAFSQTLTLEQAWARAEQANPALRAARAELEAAQGRRTDAQAFFWHNPEVAGGVARRRSPDPGFPDRRSQDWTIGLQQTFEIAGQQGYRRAVADHLLSAVRETIDATRRQVRAEVERRFIQVLGLQRRIALERETLRFIDEFARIVRKRAAAGEQNRLDRNLAEVEAERARNQLSALEEQLVQARADLAALLQLPPEQLPEAAGELAVATANYTREALLEAVANHPRIRALALREQAARDRLGLERAAVYPDITVSMSTGRESRIEQLTGLSVSVPLPLFRRNATGIGQASAELVQAQIERQAAERDARAAVNALWEKLVTARQRVIRLQASVLPALEENLHLSRTAFSAGEIGLVEILLVNRQVLDARRDLIDALIQLHLTRVDLEQSAGWPPSLAPAER